MQDMAWVHWIGVALAAPATLAIFVASWRSHVARRSPLLGSDDPRGHDDER